MFRSLLICLLLLILCEHVKAGRIKIAIVTIGKVQPTHLQMAEESIVSFYQAKVQFPLSLSIEDRMKTTQWKKETTLMVLNVKEINEALVTLESGQYDMVIGITDSAMTIGEKSWGEALLIRGFAHPELPVATISTYRLKRESENQDEFKENLTKVTRHEIGHALGLKHCAESDSCLMLNGTQWQQTIPDLCSFCRDKIDSDYLKH